MVRRQHPDPYANPKSRSIIYDFGGSIFQLHLLCIFSACISTFMFSRKKHSPTTQIYAIAVLESRIGGIYFLDPPGVGASYGFGDFVHDSGILHHLIREY